MSNINVLCVTHNSRLRNLIKILYPQLSSTSIPRFKNCAILHLQIKNIKVSNVVQNFTLNLIYEGELAVTTNSTNKYFDYETFNKLFN